MPKLNIDGNEIEVEDGMTVMQACQQAGTQIPHFCFHKRLNIAGNCRMCLVDVEKAPKLVSSCSMQINDGMVIHTNNEKVKKAREGVMEFLLINHPLDCPICDEGGDCDLQDQAFKYGKGTNRFSENKRSVQDKYMGPLIKTNMTRCIHCTRCIRFATEVAGIQEIGTLYRGENMEVTSYLDRMVESELSGNIIDLCPVGALTSKPYAFKARKWELTHTDSIDVMDAVGSNIVIDSRGLEVMRILPKLNEDINEEWISDKARFSYDGLKYQRLDRSYIKKNGKLVEASFEEAIDLIAEKLRNCNGDQMAAIAGTLACLESMFLLKNLMQTFGCHNLDCNQFGYKLDITSRANYLFNTGIKAMDQADLCLLIGASPRHSSPVLNARIGKFQRLGTLKVARIGEVDDQTYNIQELGANPLILEEILSGKHPFSEILEKAKNPMVIIGDGAYAREDGYGILSLVHKIVEKYNIVHDGWNGFNILHNHASMVGGLDIGFTPIQSGSNIAEILKKTEDGLIKLVYLLGADEINPIKLGDAFVIYQGHHGDIGANRADVVLPAAAYTEKSATYVNLEGRVQRTRAAIAPPGVAKEDWVIINEIAKKFNLNLGSSLTEVRRNMSEEFPTFSSVDEIAKERFSKFKSSDEIMNNDITKVSVNYYMTDTISRASVTMARCAKEKRG